MGSLGFQSINFEFIFFFCFLNGCLAILELLFFSKFSQNVLKPYHYIFYVFTMYFVCALEIIFRVSFPVATLLELLILLGYGYLVLKCPPALSAVTAIIAISIMQVVNGIFQSIGSLLCEATFPHVTLVLVLCSLMTLLVIYFSYQYVIRTFKIRQNISTRYIGLLLLPILFILLVLQQIFLTYGSTVVVNSDGRRLSPNVNDWSMLLIQVSAYACLFAVLFAYRKLEDNFKLQTQNILLEQQVNTQIHYMQEIQTRYDQTRGFRHDLKNHFMVLSGLIERTENQKAVTYLNKLDIATNAFSFPCQTGNMVVDLLLSEKLGLAQQKGIKIECKMTIPSGSTIDDLDLCIVFSNAIDNAINACDLVEEKEPYIIISAVQKGHFFMIEIENSCNKEQKKGTGTGIGLKNIRAVAEKYHGAVSVDHKAQIFKLNILLLI